MLLITDGNKRTVYFNIAIIFYHNYFILHLYNIIVILCP